MGLFCVIIGLGLFVLFFHPMLAGVVNAGNLFGVFFSVLLAVYGLFRKNIPVWMRRAVRILIAAGCVLMIVIGVFVVQATKRTPAEPCTVVVLGCGINGEQPSLILKKRIDAAYTYLAAHPEAACVCSGGRGEDEVISEAECIYRELRSRGIDATRLYKEERSSSTEENLRYSWEVIAQAQLNPVMAVATSDYHIYRALKQAERLGAAAYALPAPTIASFEPTYFMRECFAILKLWILPGE